MKKFAIAIIALVTAASSLAAPTTFRNDFMCADSYITDKHFLRFFHESCVEEYGRGSFMCQNWQAITHALFLKAEKQIIEQDKQDGTWVHPAYNDTNYNRSVYSRALKLRDDMKNDYYVKNFEKIKKDVIDSGLCLERK